MATTTNLPTSYVSKDFNTGETISDVLFGTGPQALITEKGLQTPEQQALLKKLLEQLGGGDGVTPYKGKLTAGLGDLEGLSLEALEQKILQSVQGTGVGAETEKALIDMLKTGGAPVDFEKYYQDVIKDPAIRDFTENVLPELTRRFGSSGAFGSDRKEAEQKATEGLGRTLVGARSELAYKTGGDAKNRILQALGLSPGIQTGGVDALMKMMEGAGLPRKIEQAGFTADYGEFQRQQGDKNKRIEQILAALGIKTKENIPQNLPGTSGWVGGAISGGMGTNKGGFF